MNALAEIHTVRLPEAARKTVKSVLFDMSDRFGMEPAAFEATLRATVVPKDCSKEQFAAFLLVAKEYNLNPLTKEIYAFPTRNGGIQPIVSIDGWCNMINSHPQLNGIEFDDHLREGKVEAITCRIWRKDREKPIVVTEYLVECHRATDPWKQYPRRMLRHKALIQGARYAFGFAGIVDPDEAERMGVSPMKDVTPKAIEPPEPQPPEPPAPANPPEPQPPEPSIDVEQWLKDLEGALAGCEDPQQLSDVWTKYAQPQEGHVSAADWMRAESLSLDTWHRVTC